MNVRSRGIALPLALPLALLLALCAAAYAGDPPPAPPADPVLDASAQKAHDAQVKEMLAWLRGQKNRETVRQQIEVMGKSAKRAERDALIAFATGNKNQEFVTHAFRALENWKDRTTFDFLMSGEGLRSGDFMIARYAAESLGNMKSTYPIAALIEVLDARSTKSEVQGACLMALGSVGGAADAAAQAAVLRYTTIKGDTVRANALEAAGRVRTPTALATLLDSVVKEKNTRCRGAACTGLGHYGGAEAIACLEKVLAEDEALTVKQAAWSALSSLGVKKPSPLPNNR